MTVYAVVLNDPDDTAWRKVKEWPNQHYILTDRLAFLVADDLVLTENIAAQVGMDKTGRVKGFVIEMTNRSGWNDSGFVEWLGKVT